MAKQYLDDPEKKRLAIRIGQRVFLWAAAAEIACIALYPFVGVMGNWMDEQSRSWSINRGLVEHLVHDHDFVLGLEVAFLASIAFIASSWLMGRKAGPAIALRKRGYGWAGPLAMLLPSILVPVVSLGSIIILEPKFLTEATRSPLELIAAPLFFGSLASFLLSIGPGILAGMVVKLTFDQVLDRAIWVPLPTDSPFEFDEKDHEVEARITYSSMKLGSIVFAIGSGILFIVMVLPATLFFRVDDYHGNTGTAFFLGGIALVAVAIWVGRWIGALARDRRVVNHWVGPTLMVLPAFAAGSVFSLFKMRAEIFASTFLESGIFLKWLTSTLEHTVVYFFPTLLMGIMATLILQYWGRNTELMKDA